MIWLLLVLYQIKHFLCDYPLQGKYMLGKFKDGNDWILPLLAHSAVHGVGTLLIACLVKPEIAFWVALFDMTIHFCMDRIKASPNMMGRWKSLAPVMYMRCQAVLNGGQDDTLTLGDAQALLKSNTYFWWALGLDQGVHHLTHYAIIWSLL